jgi:SAM-dependent methyltransferase
MSLEAFDLFKRQLFADSAMFHKTFAEVHGEFGPAWAADFDLHLRSVLGLDPDAHRDAARGYAKFSIDCMRLQVLFNRKRRYEEKTYQEANDQVYQNADYMLRLYLPGILVSQFLWRHHYRQLLYYRREFLPRLDQLEDKRFYEVGTGTGFFTTQIFRHDQRFRGTGIDISPHSTRFTADQVKGFGFSHLLTQTDRNIIGADFEPLPCIQTIEVLEHLSEPVLFLTHLRRLLRPGGVGFIAAALTAPQSDHIYLYWTPEEVIAHLEEAGFRVLDFNFEPAYQGKPNEIVPKVAAFIVTPA